MKVLFDINHPAHVHFFKNPIAILRERGVEVVITSRDKDVTIQLLQELELENQKLSAMRDGKLSLLAELVVRDYRLFKVVREEKPDVMASVGGVFIAHVGVLTATPSVVFYDTENAKLQNAITYPFASRVCVPACYESWLPLLKGVRYNGYHELSYLHPHYFEPSYQVALDNGLAPEVDNFFVRLVSWRANHDFGENGWTPELLDQVIAKLNPIGNVVISTEASLPERFSGYLYRGKKNELHHVLGNCRLFIGESATVASESAVMGVPAIYAANTGRGYTNEQEIRYQLVKNIFRFNWPLLSAAIDELLASASSDYEKKRAQLIDDTIDVAEFVADTLQNYPHRVGE